MKKFAIASLFVAVGAVTLAPAPSSALPAPAERVQDGHKHGKDEIHKLGRKTIAGYTVSVIVIGEAHAGETAKVDIKLIDAKTEPKALRVWFGAEKAEAKDKTTLTKGEKTYAGEVKVPAGTPEKGPLWVELETDAGTAAASYEIAGHDH